jgi:hypothetical protein
MKNKTNLNEIFGFGKKKNTDIKNQRSPRDRMSWETSASAFPDNLRKIKLALVDYIWDGPRLGWQSPQVQKQKQIIQSMARDCALESLQSLNKQNPNVDVSPNKVDLIAESFFVLIQRNLEKFKDLYDQKNFSGFGFHIQTLLGQALKSHTSDNRNPVPESRKNKTNLTESTQKKLLQLCNLSEYQDEVLRENVYYGEHEYAALSDVHKAIKKALQIPNIEVNFKSEMGILSSKLEKSLKDLIKSREADSYEDDYSPDEPDLGER